MKLKPIPADVSSGQTNVSTLAVVGSRADPKLTSDPQSDRHGTAVIAPVTEATLCGVSLTTALLATLLGVGATVALAALNWDKLKAWFPSLDRFITTLMDWLDWFLEPFLGIFGPGNPSASPHGPRDALDDAGNDCFGSDDACSTVFGWVFSLIGIVSTVFGFPLLPPAPPPSDNTPRTAGKRRDATVAWARENEDRTQALQIAAFDAALWEEDVPYSPSAIIAFTNPPASLQDGPVVALASGVPLNSSGYAKASEDWSAADDTAMSNPWFALRDYDTSTATEEAALSNIGALDAPALAQLKNDWDEEVAGSDLNQAVKWLLRRYFPQDNPNTVTSTQGTGEARVATHSGAVEMPSWA